jgi:hypothetical protein
MGEEKKDEAEQQAEALMDSKEADLDAALDDMQKSFDKLGKG